MKLYSKETNIGINPVINKKLQADNEIALLDNDFKQLTNNIRAYKSLSIVNETITLENYSLIDKHNYVIYNEYIKAITSNLDMEYIPIIAQETVELLPTVALNHHIALEGFLADLWNKIKSIFKSLYEKIKQLFVSYFTRFGRLERRLNNLKEVLEELSEKETDLKQTTVEKVPSSLKKKYPFDNSIELVEIEKVFDNSKLLYDSFKSTLEISKEFANKDIIDKEFIDAIKRLKDKSEKLKENKEEAETKKKESFPLTKPYKEAKSELKSINNELKETEKELADKEGKLNNIVGNESNLADLSESDKKFEIIKKEFEEYLKSISEILEKVKGKELAGGKIIKEIKLTKDDVEVETDEANNNIETLILSSKSDLLKLISASLDILPDLKKTIEASGSINDFIYKNIDAVDKLISSADKSTDEITGKYKTLLQNKVKQRLAMLKGFFSLYNKVNKLANDALTESLEGHVDYATICLKYYG